LKYQDNRAGLQTLPLNTMECAKDWFQGRDRSEAQTTDDKSPVAMEAEAPPRGKRKAWGLANKPQMGVSLFSAKGAKSRSLAYIHLVDMEHDGERVTLWFGHMTVKIVGKGLEPLVEGLRRQVVYYIQGFHVSDVEARGEARWVESIKIEPPAEEGVLGKWAG
jgi:hypothetical protein